MSNRYFACTRHRPPVEFDIADERPVPDAELGYFIRGFQGLERDFAFDGYIVCFAWSSTVELPFVGDRVIAVIYGDEHCRIPAYVGSVAAVLKTHGSFPTYLPRLRPLRLAQIEAAEFLRNLALWLPEGWRWLLSAKVRSRCHLLPIGWGVAFDEPPVPFADRRYVASFMGSIPPRSSLTGVRALTGTPKRYCRTAAVGALRKVAESVGEDRVRTSLTRDFQESLQQGSDSYFQVLASTQICVAPRGTAHETFRIYEALKLGCVVIADRLPRRSFYANSPIIEISDWRDLPDLVEELLRDPGRLSALHRASERYWREVLSEQVLTLRLARALDLPARDGMAGAAGRPSSRPGGSVPGFTHSFTP